jgi:hypothetical protein
MPLGTSRRRPVRSQRWYPSGPINRRFQSLKDSSKMGRQILFHMLPEDCEAFMSAVRQRDPIIAVDRDSTSDRRFGRSHHVTDRLVAYLRQRRHDFVVHRGAHSVDGEDTAKPRNSRGSTAPPSRSTRTFTSRKSSRVSAPRAAFRMTMAAKPACSWWLESLSMATKPGGTLDVTPGPA